jgi:O-succinylbenzoic acid--CoA ligase
MNIDWESSESHLLFNPRLSEGEQRLARSLLPTTGEFAAHLWLATSGSSISIGRHKFVALSKRSFLSSAAAVNGHLSSVRSDVWLNPLPLFHVGGLAIHARAHLSGGSVVSYGQPWNPVQFVEALNCSKATLSALVPTQVYDLVAAGVSPASSLRAVIVGGGHLSPDLLLRAQRLGWPLLPSYGMTEMCSQVATAPLDSLLGAAYPPLTLLSHVNMRFSDQEVIEIKSESLLSCYGFLSSEGLELCDPKVDGWFTSDDCGHTDGAILHLRGRASDMVKIGGEKVDIGWLERCWQQCVGLCLNRIDTALLAYEDPRLGYVIHLAVIGGVSSEIDLWVEQFNQKVMPFERIRHVHYVDAIPRSALNKLLRGQLLQQLQLPYS